MEPVGIPNRKPTFKDRFFADPFNPLVLIVIASFIAVIPQALNILAGYLGEESGLILDSLTVLADNAIKIAGVLFGVAFLVFFFRRR